MVHDSRLCSFTASYKSGRKVIKTNISAAKIKVLPAPIFCKINSIVFINIRSTVNTEKVRARKVGG